MQWLPRAPAHIGLRPKQINWIDVDKILSKNLQVWTGIYGGVYQMESSSPGLYGYYKIISEHSEYFVKILSTCEEQQQKKSNRIAKWLKGEGIETSCIINGYPKITPDENYLIIAYKNIKGHFVKTDVNELELLGSELGRMHLCMKDCKWSSEIKASSDKRHAEIMARLNEIQSNEIGSEIPEKIHELLLSVDKNLLSILVDTPQVVHGDLNYGNVLIDNNCSRVIFLDFEDTNTAWFTPLFDVSLVIERYAIVESDKTSLELAGAFLRSYFSIMQVKFKYEKQLIDILRAMSIRALLLLSFVSDSRVEKVSNDEWNKFYLLYNQAVKRSDLFKSIVSAFD